MTFGERRAQGAREVATGRSLSAANSVANSVAHLATYLAELVPHCRSTREAPASTSG